MENSPFNRLSAELRNRIYEFALIEPHRKCCDAADQSQSEATNTVSLAIRGDKITAARINACDHKPLDSNEPETVYARPASYGLTRTCRQMRQETRQLYFHLNDTLVVYPVELTSVSDSQPSALDQPNNFGNAALSKWLETTGQKDNCSIRHVIVCIPNLPRGTPDIIRTSERFYDLLNALKAHLFVDLTVSVALFMPELGSFNLRWEATLGEVVDSINAAALKARNHYSSVPSAAKVIAIIREQEKYTFFLRYGLVRSVRALGEMRNIKDRDLRLCDIWDELQSLMR